MDFFGNLLFFSVFFTPIITIPLCWKIKVLPKFLRVLLGLAFAALLSSLFFELSMAIAFRKGMGPT